MTFIRLLPVSLFSLLLTSKTGLAGEINTPAADDKQQLTQEARKIVQEFATTLKPKLKKAMLAEGPIGAVNTCAVEAPEIARTISKQTGWVVKRVSLQARNNKTARPDAWEKQQLEHFNQIVRSDPSQLEVSLANEKQFRYMKAQLVEPLCLLCHGETVAPDIMEAIQIHYPNDSATGYQLGDVRGAFSLIKTKL